MESEEVVEVQVLTGGGDGKSHCLVMPSSPSHEVSKSKLLVNTELDFDDASTARTEISTEIDDMSEKLSFGSMYLSDGGTFRNNSQGDSFDASQIVRVRSKRSDLLVSVPESCAVPKIEHEKNTNLVNASLLDLDDDDDCSESGTKKCIKTTLEEKLSTEARFDCHGRGDQSNFATAGSLVGDTLHISEHRADLHGDHSSIFTPASIAHTLNESESRAEFYRGYSQHLTPVSIATALRNSESHADFCDGRDHSFAEGTLKTDMKVGFYRVSCSDSEEPLSCRQKLEQPAIGCDESLFRSKTVKPKQKNSSREKDIGGSIFSSMTCCFAPTQP